MTNPFKDKRNTYALCFAHHIAKQLETMEVGDSKVIDERGEATQKTRTAISRKSKEMGKTFKAMVSDDQLWVLRLK